MMGGVSCGPRNLGTFKLGRTWWIFLGVITVRKSRLGGGLRLWEREQNLNQSERRLRPFLAGRVSQRQKLQMRAKLEEQKFSDIAFARDQNDRLPVTGKASFVTCEVIFSLLFGGRAVVPSLHNWLRDVWLDERHHRWYAELFNRVPWLQPWLNHSGERGLPSLESYGMQRLMPWKTVSVKVETDREASHVNEQSFQSAKSELQKWDESWVLEQRKKKSGNKQWSDEYEDRKVMTNCMILKVCARSPLR